MKKLTIFAALCALLLGSCAENNLDGVTPENNITLPDLTAGFAEGETKTYVHNNTYLRWHEADLITAFYGNSLNRQYKFKGKTGDNSGTFSLIPSGELGTGNDLGAIYAVYPYDENAGINDETREISLTLPATQTYAENSFGKGANTMIAVTENLEDTFLGFKNACGYLKLKLYGEDVTLASVEVKGNNGEKIAGSATATMEFGGVPTLAMNNDATTTVTLDCGEGVVLGTSAETATELWIVLPETTFEGGITITAIDTDGNVFEKSTTKTVAIVRNEIQPMAAIEFVKPLPIPANNEIFYTNGSTTSATIPYKTDCFGGANIVSNTYDEKVKSWVLKFDKDLTSLGDGAFSAWSSANNRPLTTITLPNSITSFGNQVFEGCGELVSVKLPDGLMTMGFRTFCYCGQLPEVVLPNTITTIPSETFYYCAKLENFVIPEGVTTIGSGAFYYCENITSIVIPKNVNSIEYNSFHYCGLESVYCESTTPPTLKGPRPFRYCNYYLKIYVPQESVSLYQDSWEEYSNEIVGYDF